MDKTNIRSFTLEEMISRYKDNDNVIFYDGCAIGTKTPGINDDLLRYPIRIDAYVVCLVRKGHGMAISNTTHCDLHRNVMLLHAPEHIISLEDGDQHSDYDMDVFAFSPEFMRKINLDIKRIVPLLAQVTNISSIELSERDMNMLEATFNGLRMAIPHLRSMRFFDEIIRRFIEMMFYMLFDIIYQHLDIREESQPSVKNRNQEYFGRFIKCLHENYKSERSVGFYAAQLHITPKYLTTVIKNVSGRSAAAWIDEYVILEAKNLLKYSTMSIQEVAYALNFPNQSFFGKYFKHHTAMSPSAYKSQK